LAPAGNACSRSASLSALQRTADRDVAERARGSARALPEIRQFLPQTESGLKPESLFDRVQLEIMPVPLALEHEGPSLDVDLLAAVLVAQEERRVALHRLLAALARPRRRIALRAAHLHLRDSRGLVPLELEVVALAGLLARPGQRAAIDGEVAPAARVGHRHLLAVER